MISTTTIDSALHPVVMAVPPAERMLIRGEKVAALRRRARLALDLSARCSGIGIILGELRKDNLGAPLPYEGAHWSISHKDCYVAAVTASRPVGIDIEMIRPVKEALHQRIADDSEWALVTGERRLFFFRIWTAKEAVLKAIGKGMTALGDCRVTTICDDRHMGLSVGGTPWMVTHHWVDRQHLAAVTTRGENIHWHHVPPDTGLEKNRKIRNPKHEARNKSE